MAPVIVILQIIFWFSFSVAAVTYIVNSLTDWTDQEIIGCMKVALGIAATSGVSFLAFI